MTRMLKTILIGLMLGASFTLPAAAQTVLTGADRSTKLQEVEAYLNSITTMQSEFIQTHSDGSRFTGKFYLNRPGRLRFEYAPPSGDYIVADGLLVHYWDNEVKNYSNAPIGSTLADFLLRKKIKLSGDLSVQEVKAVPDNRLLITLIQSADPQAGKLSLLFDQGPLRLRRWRVIDGTNAMTEVSLYNIQTGIRIDPRLFIFKTPKGFETEAEKR